MKTKEKIHECVRKIPTWANAYTKYKNYYDAIIHEALIAGRLNTINKFESLLKTLGVDNLCLLYCYNEIYPLEFKERQPNITYEYVIDKLYRDVKQIKFKITKAIREYNKIDFLENEYYKDNKQYKYIIDSWNLEETIERHNLNTHTWDKINCKDVGSVIDDNGCSTTSDIINTQAYRFVLFGPILYIIHVFKHKIKLSFELLVISIISNLVLYIPTIISVYISNLDKVIQ